MHPERGLAVLWQNIVRVRNFCNCLQPNAPVFKGWLILDVTKWQLTNVIKPIICNMDPIFREPRPHRAPLLKLWMHLNIPLACQKLCNSQSKTCKWTVKIFCSLEITIQARVLNLTGRWIKNRSIRTRAHLAFWHIIS